MQLDEDLREFIELLNANDVDHVIVGGFAVAGCPDSLPASMC